MAAKKMTVLTAMVLAGVAVSAASAYADEGESQERESRQENRTEREDGEREEGMRQERSGSGTMQRRGGGVIDQYLRTDLTKTDMDALKAVLDKQRESMKALADSLKDGTVTRAEFEIQAKALREAHVAAVSQYVATDKIDAFRSALAAMPTVPPKNGQERGERGRMENGSGSMNVSGNRQARENKLLPAAIGTKIDAKLASLADDAARIDWINAVITKVEILENKAKSKKSKSLFSELKDLLNEKLDAIDGTTSEEGSLDNLLQ